MAFQDVTISAKAKCQSNIQQYVQNTLEKIKNLEDEIFTPIDAETFDFDIPFTLLESDLESSTVSNLEDEVFFGPVSHTEKCAAAAALQEKNQSALNPISSPQINNISQEGLTDGIIEKAKQSESDLDRSQYDSLIARWTATENVQNENNPPLTKSPCSNHCQPIEPKSDRTYIIKRELSTNRSEGTAITSFKGSGSSDVSMSSTISNVSTRSLSRSFLPRKRFVADNGLTPKSGAKVTRSASFGYPKNETNRKSVGSGSNATRTEDLVVNRSLHMPSSNASSNLEIPGKGTKMQTRRSLGLMIGLTLPKSEACVTQSNSVKNLPSKTQTGKGSTFKLDLHKPGTFLGKSFGFNNSHKCPKKGPLSTAGKTVNTKAGKSPKQAKDDRFGMKRTNPAMITPIKAEKCVQPKKLSLSNSLSSPKRVSSASQVAASTPLSSSKARRRSFLPTPTKRRLETYDINSGSTSPVLGSCGSSIEYSRTSSLDFQDVVFESNADEASVSFDQEIEK